MREAGVRDFRLVEAYGAEPRESLQSGQVVIAEALAVEEDSGDAAVAIQFEPGAKGDEVLLRGPFLGGIGRRCRFLLGVGEDRHQRQQQRCEYGHDAPWRMLASSLAGHGCFDGGSAVVSERSRRARSVRHARIATPVATAGAVSSAISPGPSPNGRSDLYLGP